MIKLNPWSGGSQEEYESQLFGFGAQRLKNAVRLMVEQKIRTGVKDMESYLQKSLKLNETDEVTLTRSCDKLIQLYCERAEPSLDIIDQEIEKILQIPPNALLPEDEVQLEQISDANYEKLKEEVVELRKRIERAALMEALLQGENEELTSVEKICEVGEKDMKSLDLIQRNIDKSQNLSTIQNATQFLCVSVPFLKNNDSMDDLFDEC